MNRREQVAGADKSTGDKLPRVTQFPQATRNAQPAKCCEGAQEARTSSVFSDAIHAESNPLPSNIPSLCQEAVKAQTKRNDSCF